MTKTKKQPIKQYTEVLLRFERDMTTPEVIGVVAAVSVGLPKELEENLVSMKITKAVYEFDKTTFSEKFNRKEVNEKIDKSYIG